MSKCAKHPKYKAERKPTAKCWDCWYLWWSKPMSRKEIGASESAKKQPRVTLSELAKDMNDSP